MKKKYLVFFFGLLIYCSLSLFYFGGGLITHLEDRVGGVNAVDPYQALWFLSWWKFALLHHIQPFSSSYLFAPVGTNLTKVTSIPGIALLGFPLYFLGPPQIIFNLAYIFGPGLAAFTMFILVHYLTRQWIPALFAGYFFGFSGYMIGQMMGHLNLTFGVFLIPLIVLVCFMFFDGKISKWGARITIALLMTLLFLICSEIAVTFYFCSSIACLYILLIIKPPKDKSYSIMITLIWATVIMLVLISPYLYYFMINKPAFYIPRLIGFYNDLLSFVIPSKNFLLKNATTTQIFSLFRPGGCEIGAYLGFPLILLISLFCIKNWREPATKCLTALMITYAVISLGNSVHFAQYHHFPNIPFKYVFKIPIIKFSLASRYSLFTSFIVALIVGYWLVNYSSYYYAKIILTLAAILFLIPAHSHSTTYRFHTINFFSSGTYKKWLPPNATVLMLPFNYSGRMLAAQQQTDFYFKLTMGYTGIPLPKVFERDPLARKLIFYHDILSPQELKEFINEYHPNYLFIIGDRTPWQNALRILNLKRLYQDKSGALFKI